MTTFEITFTETRRYRMVIEADSESTALTEAVMRCDHDEDRAAGHVFSTYENFNAEPVAEGAAS